VRDHRRDEISAVCGRRQEERRGSRAEG
jgi:hypothetical protein